jgi:hypothetical protein
MTRVDSIIVNLTELFCHRLQVLTGRTNVWLALHLTNLSIVVYFVWAGLYSWSLGRAERALFVLFCGGLLWVLMQTVFSVPIEAYETAAYERVAKGLRNPRRMRDASLRISFLTLSLLLGYPVYLAYSTLRIEVVLLSYALIVLTTAVLYLLACDPLPPCAGKVRQWLRTAVRPGVPATEASGRGPEASLTTTTSAPSSAEGASNDAPNDASLAGSM